MNCPLHSKVKLNPEWCHLCVADYENKPDVTKMTARKRADELTAIPEIATVPMSTLHERIEKLVGRPVQTMELINRIRLVDEILSGNPISIEQSIEYISRQFNGKLITFDGNKVEEVEDEQVDMDIWGE